MCLFITFVWIPGRVTVCIRKALFPTPSLPCPLLFPSRKLFASGQTLSFFFRKMCPFSRFRKAKKAQNHNTVPGVMLCVIRTIRMCPVIPGSAIEKNSILSDGVSNVGITYLPGQSPAKYCRRL